MKLKKNNSNKKNFHFFHWTFFLVFFLSKSARLSVHSFIILILFIISISFFFRKRIFSKVFFSLPSQRKIFIHSQTKVNCQYSLSYLRRKKKRKKFLVYITEFPVIHVHIIFPLFFMFFFYLCKNTIYFRTSGFQQFIEIICYPDKNVIYFKNDCYLAVIIYIDIKHVC